MSMSDFLHRHQDMLVSRLSYWHGDLAREKIHRLLRNFRFVAETYAMQIPIADSHQALADFSMLLGLWAAAARGVGVMYGAGEV